CRFYVRFLRCLKLFDFGKQFPNPLGGFFSTERFFFRFLLGFPSSRFWSLFYGFRRLFRRGSRGRFLRIRLNFGCKSALFVAPRIGLRLSLRRLGRFGQFSCFSPLGKSGKIVRD